MVDHPQLLHTVLDTTDVRALAEFYRELLGLQYRPGDEPPADRTADEPDWLALTDPNGARKLAFQRVERLERTTRPRPDGTMQLPLAMPFPPAPTLQLQRQWAGALGARLLFDRADDPDEPLY